MVLPMNAILKCSLAKVAYAPFVCEQRKSATTPEGRCDYV